MATAGEKSAPKEAGGGAAKPWQLEAKLSCLIIVAVFCHRYPATLLSEYNGLRDWLTLWVVLCASHVAQSVPVPLP